jgi:lactoylglutathione lyase
MTTTPFIRKINAARMRVPDLDSGLAFYRDKLGHQLIWRTPTAAGLRLPGSDEYLVIFAGQDAPNVSFVVSNVEPAVERFLLAGGKIARPVFDIVNGKAVVVQDPFGNQMILLDDSKGELVLDEDGNVIGVDEDEYGA